MLQANWGEPGAAGAVGSWAGNGAGVAEATLPADRALIEGWALWVSPGPELEPGVPRPGA